MHVQPYLTIVAVFVSLCSFTRPSRAFSDEELGAIQRLVTLGNAENENEAPEPDIPEAFLGDPNREYRPYTLMDILNTKINTLAELCSPENVRQYLRSGNLGYLIKCKYLAQRKNNSSNVGPMETRSSARSSNVMESYSGKLLKRLFQNGIPRFNMAPTPPVGDDVTSDATPEKRSRLSINGALGSLVDMLHQESRKHRRPVYAFHRELLHLG